MFETQGVLNEEGPFISSNQNDALSRVLFFVTDLIFIHHFIVCSEFQLKCHACYCKVLHRISLLEFWVAYLCIHILRYEAEHSRHKSTNDVHHEPPFSSEKTNMLVYLFISKSNVSAAALHVQESKFVYGFVNFVKIFILCSCRINVFPVDQGSSDVTFL